MSRKWKIKRTPTFPREDEREDMYPMCFILAVDYSQQQLNFALCRIRLFLDLWVVDLAELISALKRSQQQRNKSVQIL
jgi:hypothetical protein